MQVVTNEKKILKTRLTLTLFSFHEFFIDFPRLCFSKFVTNRFSFQINALCHKLHNDHVTCDIFSQILNLRIHDFFQEKCLVHICILKELQSFFFVKMNSFSNIFDLNRKILPCFKRKQENFPKKIRRFGVHENISRTR